jgi:hypothetical protein
MMAIFRISGLPPGDELFAVSVFIIFLRAQRYEKFREPPKEFIYPFFSLLTFGG